MFKAQPSHPIFGKLIGGRYYILQILGFGLLGRTYLAQDIRQKGTPKCVIKHLNLVNDNNNSPTVKRLFCSEAEILKHLGHHEQIPQVLATFENENGFYLVQEFIPGQSLANLLPSSIRCGQRWTEPQVLELLQDVLVILDFIHYHNIIHCNINPSNIIKHAESGKLFIIDLSAVQPIQTTPDEQDQLVALHLSPAGYISPEQLAFQPRPSSDIYALGNIAIQALTGLRPAQLQIDEYRTWQQEVSVSDELVNMLNRMVQPDYKNRYQTATEVMRSLQILLQTQQPKIAPNQIAGINPPLLVQTPQPPSLILPSFESINTPDLPISLFPIPLPPLEFDPDQPIHIPGIPPVLIALTISLAAIAANYVVIEAGIHDIIEPDPKQLKLVKPVVKEEQLLNWAEELCKIPYLCFFQGLPLSEAEVYQLLKKAYARAYKGDFTSALKYLEQITPSSPQYDRAKLKIAEYRKKQAIKNAKMGIAASSNNRR